MKDQLPHSLGLKLLFNTRISKALEERAADYNPKAERRDYPPHPFTMAEGENIPHQSTENARFQTRYAYLESMQANG